MVDLNISYPSTPKAQELYDITIEESLNVEEQEWFSEVIKAVEDLEDRVEQLEG